MHYITTHRTAQTLPNNIQRLLTENRCFRFLLTIPQTDDKIFIIKNKPEYHQERETPWAEIRRRTRGHGLHGGSS